MRREGAAGCFEQLLLQGTAGGGEDHLAEQAITGAIVLEACAGRACGRVAHQVAHHHLFAFRQVHLVAGDGIAQAQLAVLHERHDDQRGKGLGDRGGCVSAVSSGKPP